MSHEQNGVTIELSVQQFIQSINKEITARIYWRLVRGTTGDLGIQ